MAQAATEHTEGTEFRVYGYRWVVLLLFILVNLLMQMHWIHFASIVSRATAFYGVSALGIDLLSIIFLLVYLVVSFPASYAIDSWGLRAGVGVGVALLGFFGLMKGLYGTNYKMLLVAQTGLAVGQPFINNAITKVGARWFPLRERAMAAGLGTLAQIVGILLALGLTPFLVQSFGMKSMLIIYGLAAASGSVLYFVFTRERPPTPPCPPGQDERFEFFAGLKHIFRQRDMVIMLAGSFFGLGVFNAVTTWIEQILSPRGFGVEQAGIAGALLMCSGIFGAVLMGALSDKLRKRKVFILIAMFGAIPGLIGLTFADGYPLLLVSCFVFGFFFIGGGPVNFQYSAEVSYPAPEGTTQGLFMLSGQISGILFVFIPDLLLKGGAKTPALAVFIGFLVLTFLLFLTLRESRHIMTGDI